MTGSNQGTHRHPASLFYIAIVSAFFNYALGTLNSLLVLYLTRKLHMDEASAYAIFAAFNALIFTLPIIGGYLASKYDYRLAICVGVAFTIVALVITSYLNLTAFYIGLGLFSVGYGLALPALFSLPSLAYDRHDPRRASGMTLFYIIMNIGFLAAGFTSGYISQLYSYQAAFLIAAVSLLACLIFMFINYNRIHTYKPELIRAATTHSNKWIIGLFSLCMLIALPLACLFIHYNSYANAIMWVAIALSIIVVFTLAAKQQDKLAKQRLYAFLVLEIIGLFFWTIYMLEPSLVTLFIAHNVDRHVFGYLIPTASFYSLDPIFVILFGFILSYVWRAMAKRHILPSTPAKFSFAIIVMGCATLVLYRGILSNNDAHLTHSFWVIIAYALFSIAELLIGPIGIAMVGKLAPRAHVGTLMGIFNLFIGFSAILAGYVGKATTVPEHASLLQTNHIYAHTFLVLGVLTVAFGLIATCFVPTLERLIEKKAV